MDSRELNFNHLGHEDPDRDDGGGNFQFFHEQMSILNEEIDSLRTELSKQTNEAQSLSVSHKKFLKICF